MRAWAARIFRKGRWSRAGSPRSKRTSRSSTSVSRPKAAFRSRNSASTTPARRPSRSATPSRCSSSVSKTRSAKPSSAVTRPAAKRPGPVSKAYSPSNEPVMGAIVGRVKGGFTVDLGGASAFLPGSQVDIRPVRDVGPLMGKEQPFAILKMDRPRGNIVVSRRAILEEARAEQRTELVSQLLEGEVREGVVKNITDYGAFVDLGGIDGLLHVTDMSWKRVSHPSQVLAVGDTVKVQIVKINPDTQRISLGMKQLQSDPWDGVEAKYPPGARFTGRITNITDYGAFVELEAGVEGSGPRLGNELDQEERPSRQDRLHLAGSRCGGAGCRRLQAARQPGSQTGHAKSLGTVSGTPSAGLGGRGRSQERHGVRPVHRPGQRHRRNGAPLGHRLERRRRGSHGALQEGRDGQGQGARRRRREGTHQPGHQTARRRSDGQRRLPQGADGDRHGDRSDQRRHRGQVSATRPRR